MDAIHIGWTLACEEHGPRELVAHARGAEDAGFAFAMVSDHYHPWVDRQGHSPFVIRQLWAGGLAERVACGPDPERHLELLRLYADAGYDHVFVHQVGPDQEGALRFYEREVLPHVGELSPARAA